jgi:hypothetical protein
MGMINKTGARQFCTALRYGNQARSKVKDSRSRRFDLSAQMGNPFPQGFAGSNPARSTTLDKHLYCPPFGGLTSLTPQ